MTDVDYAATHFEGMALLARELARLPAEVKEHRYAPDAFGSWLLVVRHKGSVAMVNYDGKDGHAGIRVSDDRNPPHSYGSEKTIGEGVTFASLSAEAVAAICESVKASASE